MVNILQLQGTSTPPGMLCWGPRHWQPQTQPFGFLHIIVQCCCSRYGAYSIHLMPFLSYTHLHKWSCYNYSHYHYRYCII